MIRSLWLTAGAAALIAVRGGAQDTTLYRAAVMAIAYRQAIDDSVADPGARSILLAHGHRTARSVVLFHGLTDSPRQFEKLAHMFYEGGDNVFVPRLPRHGMLGGTIYALAPLEADELRGCADSSADIAFGLGDSVIVVGLSLGANMAAWVAQDHPLTRALLIAPALEAGRIPSIIQRPLIGLSDRLPKVTVPSHPGNGRPDREPGFSSHAVAEVLKLGESVLHRAEREPPLTPRIVILTNAADRTVSDGATMALSRAWTAHGAAVWFYEIPDSLRLPHNILDPLHGEGGGEPVLQLLRALAHGEMPSAIVNGATTTARETCIENDTSRTALDGFAPRCSARTTASSPPRPW